MNLKRFVASVATAGLVALGGAVVLASPAAALDHGPLLPGNIFLLNEQIPLASATPSTIITSGAGAGRQWQSITVDQPCIAGTTNFQSFVRIPMDGVADPNAWNEVGLNAYSVNFDAQGLPYSYGNNAGFAQADVIMYLNSHGHTSDKFKLITVCQDNDAMSLAYFQTDVTISNTGLTDGTDITWSLNNPPTLPQVSTSTALSAAPTTAEQGDAVTLTATVTPSTATGDVEFFAGATSLGTAAVSGGTAAKTVTDLPVGANDVTATFVGNADYSASTSPAVTVTVNPVAPRATTTTLGVDPTTGDPYQSVTFTATVASPGFTPNGTVNFYNGATLLGSSPVTGGTATFTTNTLGEGTFSLSASFVGQAPYTNSDSAAVSATYAATNPTAPFNLTVSIPAGALMITTPYTVANPLPLGLAVLDPADSTYSASAPISDIVITDTRAGAFGWHATAQAGAFTQAGSSSTFDGSYVGLTGLAANPVDGNALDATDVVVTNHAPASDGLATAKTFASYASGLPIGTANISGVVSIDQVPTSVLPGDYQALVVFTAISGE